MGTPLTLFVLACAPAAVAPDDEVPTHDSGEGAFSGIETLAWDGADGLVGTWAPAGPARLIIEDADGVSVGSSDTDTGGATVSGLPEGAWYGRVEADGEDGGRRLRQRVGAERLVLRAELAFAGGGRALDGEGTLLAVGGGDQGDGPAVMIVDVSDPAAPVRRATIDGLGEVSDVDLADGHLYVAVDTVLHPDAPYAVRIYDLADPDAPVEVGQVPASEDAAHTLTVGDGALFLASTTNQCEAIWDVSDPSAPERVGSWAPPPPAGLHDQTWVDGLLYVAWTQGMSIVDVRDPAAPVLVAIEEAAWADPFVHNLWPTTDGAALAMSEEVVGGGVRVYDLADPAAPVFASLYQHDPQHSVHNVVVRDDFAFAAWYVDGVVVLDLGDPYTPVLVGEYDTFTLGNEDPDDRPDGTQWPNVSGATHVWPFGDVVAVSDQMRGLILLDFYPSEVRWGGAWSE